MTSVYHQNSVTTILISSYTYQFFEKNIFCIVLQKISCIRQFESKLSLRSFELSFRVKDC